MNKLKASIKQQCFDVTVINRFK